MVVSLEIVTAAQAANRPDLRGVVKWVTGHIACPHEDLGRRGPVCPWVSGALSSNRLSYVSAPNRTDAEGVRAVVLEVRAWFRELPSLGKPPYPAVIIVYSNLAPDGKIVVDVHRDLKGTFVSEGLMLGEFFPGCMTPGLHNPAFPALSSPVPLFVIRPMIDRDLIFLMGDPQWIAHYSQHFGGERFAGHRESLVDRDLPGRAVSRRRQIPMNGSIARVTPWSTP